MVSYVSVIKYFSGRKHHENRPIRMYGIPSDEVLKILLGHMSFFEKNDMMTIIFIRSFDANFLKRQISKSRIFIIFVRSIEKD